MKNGRGADGGKALVLVAEGSATMAALLSGALERSGFCVEVVPDGNSALDFVARRPPACIVADRVLAGIDGRLLCSIVKDGMELGTLPFVVFAAESPAEGDYMDSFCAADSVLYLDADGAERVAQEVSRLLSREWLSFDDSAALPDVPPAVFAARALDRNLLFSFVLHSLSDAGMLLGDADALSGKLLGVLLEAFRCDCAVLILDGKPVSLYADGLGFLDDASREDLERICLSDFSGSSGIAVQPGSGVIRKHAAAERNARVPEGGPDGNAPGAARIESYRCIPVMGEAGFVGSFHVASRRADYFDTRTDRILQFFAERAAILLEQSLRIHRAARTEERLRSAFSRFVPEEIIDSLLRTESRRAGFVNEKREVAILICDIRDFTTLSECNQPEDVVSFLNGYFARMVKVIKDHGGSIDKFMGDAIMALFGAPVSYADNASRALRAAQDMLALLPGIPCDSLVFPPGMELDIGIGIHYGEVIVGSIGCDDKSDYTVIGDSVNLASRLEGLTKIYDTRIIVSQAVKDALDGPFRLLHVDTVRVKGKSVGIPIYSADLPPDNEAYESSYAKAMGLYMNGVWGLAASYFRKALEAMPESRAAALMARRCEDFLASPPQGWDGAVSLTMK